MTKLEELLQVIKKDHIYIQTHNYPDPDAISSAYGIQKLLAYKGISSTICYRGKIARYNTLKLIELLEMELVSHEDMEDKLQEEDEIILVDVQKGNANIMNMTGTEIICIDHHPVFEKSDYRYADIRPEYGACATLVAEYFFENNIPMDKNTATALSYGIRCDTDRLARGTCKKDLEVLCSMYDMSDQYMIQMLENRELYSEDLTAYSKAIDNIQIFDKSCFSYTGENCPEALIASVADFMLALVEVDLSVVYGIQKNGIKFSVRSEEGMHDAGWIISRALRGIGNGGGHAVMAGGFIPLAEGSLPPEKLIRTAKERILGAIKEDAERDKVSDTE